MAITEDAQEEHALIDISMCGMIKRIAISNQELSSLFGVQP